jgi:hypothetical protein
MASKHSIANIQKFLYHASSISVFNSSTCAQIFFLNMPKPISSNDDDRNIYKISSSTLVNDNEVIKEYFIVKTVQSLTECKHIVVIFARRHSDEIRPGGGFIG